MVSGVLCQNVPCTNTASLALGYTKSGEPGSMDLTSLLLSSFARTSSGLVPDPLLERIERETADEVGRGDRPTGREM